MAFNLRDYADRVEGTSPVQVYGKVLQVVGLTVEATGPPMSIGDLCYVQPPRTGLRIPVEVVGLVVANRALHRGKSSSCCARASA